jgi:hypothetical protein
MTENAIAKEIVDAAFRIHTTLGPGLLINFHVALIKDGIPRIVNGLEDDDHAKSPSRIER